MHLSSYLLGDTESILLFLKSGQNSCVCIFVCIVYVCVCIYICSIYIYI